MKKALKITLIIVLAILLKFIYTFVANEIIISNFNKKIYNNLLIKSLYILNFPQSYIVYYNDGNLLYNQGKFDKAIDKYKSSISKNPPQDRICDIRVNLSLAMIKNINSIDAKEVYNILEEAKNNLYNDNCASKTDDSGRSKEAEQLEEEIKKLQEQIETTTDSNSKDNDDNNDNDEDDKEEKELEEQLKKIESNAKNGRKEDLELDENLSDYSYYSGKRW